MECNHFRQSIEQALEIFFKYLDERDPAVRQPPPEGLAAFDFIVDYYTTRLVNVVKIFPGDPLAIVCDPHDLYQHAWSALWLKGGSIKKRTPAGVCAWLKMVVHNYKSDLREEVAGEMKLEFDDDGNESRLEAVLCRMVELEVIPEPCPPEAVYHRYRLLCRFIRRALTRLDNREEEILRLSRRGYTLTEIARAMNFSNLNAASSFKKRVLAKLATRLHLLFLRELKLCKRGDDNYDVIADWAERFHRKGENRRCVIRNR